jgi:hypothetical protein
MRYVYLIILEMLSCAYGHDEDIKRESSTTLANPPSAIVPILPSSSPPSRHEPLQEEKVRDTLHHSRMEDIKRWADFLFWSKYTWYRVSNFADTTSKILALTTPILTAVNVHYASTPIQIAATVTGTSVVAFLGFSHYARRESVERGAGLNRILGQEGVPTVVIINDASSGDGVPAT